MQKQLNVRKISIATTLGNVQPQKLLELLVQMTMTAKLDQFVNQVQILANKPIMKMTTTIMFET